MFKKLKRFFGFRSPDKPLADRLFVNILMPKETKDYFRWPLIK